jgi:hypothetical protein
MTTLKAGIHVARDGKLSGKVAGLPPGEHGAEITLLEAPEPPVPAADLLAGVRATEAEVALLAGFASRSADGILGCNGRGRVG